MRLMRLSKFTEKFMSETNDQKPDHEQVSKDKENVRKNNQGRRNAGQGRGQNRQNARQSENSEGQLSEKNGQDPENSESDATPRIYEDVSEDKPEKQGVSGPVVKNAEAPEKKLNKSASQLTPGKRKLRKLRDNPGAFFKDSGVFGNALKGVSYTWAKFGLFSVVLLLCALVIVYFGVVATDRYATETQFVVKQSDSNDLALSGLASLGSVAPTMRDAYIIEEFIQSRDMVMALDKALNLRAHYQSPDIDYFSRLEADATTEEFVEYYRDRVEVRHDELSDIVYVEVQAFSPEFSLAMGRELLQVSEQFINGLGDKMVREQMAYAETEVTRAHNVLQDQQKNLLTFQDENRLYSPEQEGGAILQAVNSLQAQIITEQAKLKNMLATIREDTPLIKAQRDLIRSLQQQLEEEKQKLASPDEESFNKVNVEYGEIELQAALAADLYKSSLAGLESVRSEAYRKLKHLLIVQSPSLAEESKYPRRIYNILTWVIVIVAVYLLTMLVTAIVREHSE